MSGVRVARRILIICGAGIVSGKEMMALELARGLHDRGYVVEMVSSSWGAVDFPRRASAIGIPVHLMRLGFISATLKPEALRMTLHQACYWPSLLFLYRSLLRRMKPDRVIHTTWHHLVLLFPFLSADRDIYWLHEVLPTTKQYRQLFGALQKRLRYLVAVSTAAGDSLRSLGIPSDKLKVIHNGIADPAGNDVRKTVSTEPFRVGIIGQIGEWKGHDDLVEAFGILQEQQPTAELHIFGDGNADYVARLKTRIAADALNNVTWHGFVADREAIFPELSVCVIPSRSQDPLPTVAIEAAFFGKPVIAAKSGGLREIVVDGVTGFVVNQRAASEIAACLSKLASEPSLLRQLGEAARLHAVKNFSAARFTSAFDELLNS